MLEMDEAANNARRIETKIPWRRPRDSNVL